jgi:hypothetical protein
MLVEFPAHQGTGVSRGHSALRHGCAGPGSRAPSAKPGAVIPVSQWEHKSQVTLVDDADLLRGQSGRRLVRHTQQGLSLHRKRAIFDDTFSA